MEGSRYTDEKPRNGERSYQHLRDYSYNLCAYRAIKREIDERTELVIKFMQKQQIEDAYDVISDIRIFYRMLQLFGNKIGDDVVHDNGIDNSILPEKADICYNDELNKVIDHVNNEFNKIYKVLSELKYEINELKFELVRLNKNK